MVLAKDFLPCSDFSFERDELVTNSAHYKISNIMFSDNKFGGADDFDGLVIVKAMSWVPILLEDITIQNSD